ncbi:serine hydrolase domain-containing protein [Thioalkalivibrio thiocyanoxidans]|uniref:serine hydrolase domain-containing protein n=1 Tax=Thioalkalivibrio thiocyanoxidans TaxID=152475 RepID=UPI00037F585B|nr:serine hydrolase domain-containing protein [Thioalkalivibrio thiocyanoxidans]
MVDAIRHGNVPPVIERILEHALRDLVGLRGVRHAVLGVEPGDGSYRWVGAAGIADPSGAPMTPGTPYCLASVTKLYIGAAVLRLQEQGRLAIDDPLTDHLPDGRVAGLHRRRGVDRTAELTLRHLLGHASGLPEYLVEAPRGQQALLDRVVEGDLSWTLSDVMDWVRAARGAHFAPRAFDGGRYTVRYSDTNFQLLMAVIEAVTRQPVHEAFASLIYEPLGLTRTWHPGTPPEVSMPAAATLWAGDQPLDRPLALASFRDLFSTAEETLRFLRALITGQLFDDPATAQSMWGHWNPLGFTLIPVAPGWPIEYGLAMMRFRTPRLLRPFFPVPTLIGHSGASGSWLFYAPEPDLYITGTVDQLKAPAVPFKQVPRLVQKISSVL